MDYKGPNIQLDDESEYEMYENFFFVVAAVLIILLPLYFCRTEQDEYKKLKRESNRLKREEKQKRKQEKRSRTSLQSEESNSTDNSNSSNSIFKETNQTENFSKEKLSCFLIRFKKKNTIKQKQFLSLMAKVI